MRDSKAVEYERVEEELEKMALGCDLCEEVRGGDCGGPLCSKLVRLCALDAQAWDGEHEVATLGKQGGFKRR